MQIKYSGILTVWKMNVGTGFIYTYTTAMRIQYIWKAKSVVKKLTQVCQEVVVISSTVLVGGGRMNFLCFPS